MSDDDRTEARRDYKQTEPSRSSPIAVLVDAGRWEELRGMGSNAIHGLVAAWRSVKTNTGWDSVWLHGRLFKGNIFVDVNRAANIARILYKLGWKPDDAHEQTHFFRDFITWPTNEVPTCGLHSVDFIWEDLLAVGDTAAPLLISQGKWDLLVRTGDSITVP